MLTGDEIPSTGNAFISGINMSDNQSGYLSHIGYCPQFDSIIDELTGRELTRLFGRLRGIPSYLIESEVKKWLYFVGNLIIFNFVIILN